MPRISRHKAKLHSAAVSLPKRSFAVPSTQVDEVVLPGSAPTATLDALPPIVHPEASSSKRKLPLVVPDQSIPLHPYSRSHRKRENKKARQLLAGGSLDPLASALEDVSGHNPSVKGDARKKTRDGDAGFAKHASTPNNNDGKVADGRSRTLNEKARRKQIEREGLRARMVSKLPAFKQSPWAAIREHASNTLAQKEK